MNGADPELEEGWVDHVVAAEFPELRLRWMEHPAPLPGRRKGSPPEIKGRLRILSSRFHGAQAITMRRDPIPQAYRVFFRSIGLDPDTTRTPIEEAALERLFDGHFVSRGHVLDALRIALVETGVPLWAVDAEGLDGPLGIRMARETKCPSKRRSSAASSIGVRVVSGSNPIDRKNTR